MSQKVSRDEYKRLLAEEGNNQKERRDEEHNHQAAFIRIIDLPHNRRIFPDLKFVFAPPNGGRRDAKTGAKLKAEGVRPGVPDILCLIPRQGYYGLIIENKFKNRLSDAQKEFFDFFTRMNFLCVQSNSCDESLDYLESYLEIKLVRK